MKLIVGLGNPGREYEETRHNAGFQVLDLFADRFGLTFDKEGFKSFYLKINRLFDEDNVILLKPQTYMNNSGEAVGEFSRYFKIPVEDILVVYDEMSLAPGMFRLKPGGSSAGHKGIQSIINHLGTDKIKRLKVGIGEPAKGEAVDFVLGKPKGDEKERFQKAIETSVEILIDYLKDGFEAAMNKFNQKGKEN